MSTILKTIRKSLADELCINSDVDGRKCISISRRKYINSKKNETQPEGGNIFAEYSNAMIYFYLGLLVVIELQIFH